MHTRRFASVITLLAGFTISACSAFFVPDGVVEYCNNGEDCTEPDDNRLRAQCVFGADQPQNSQKVCIADFVEINCDPNAYKGKWIEQTFLEATSPQTKLLYVACDDANRGKQGCAPMDGTCEAGLEVNEAGVCDEPGADIPAINPANVGGPDIAGADVKDAFCRAYFCDDEFVCAPSGSKQLCKQCDPSKPYGEGGCGTMYIQGAPSPVYAAEADRNCDGDIDADAIVGGSVPTAP
jgi:hypothetical protein